MRTTERTAGLRRGVVRLTRALQGKDEAHKLLCSVRDGDVIVLPSARFEIGSEGLVPMTDVLCGVVACIARVAEPHFSMRAWALSNFPDW